MNQVPQSNDPRSTNSDLTLNAILRDVSAEQARSRDAARAATQRNTPAPAQPYPQQPQGHAYQQPGNGYSQQPYSHQTTVNNYISTSFNAPAYPQRKRNNPWVHVLLALFTAGIGNICYALYVWQWNADRGL